MFQACRGNKLDHGVEVADAIGEEPEQKIYRIPEEADFLYAYSTAPGMWTCRMILNCFKNQGINII